MRNLLGSVLVMIACSLSISVYAQNDTKTFHDFQFSFVRVTSAWSKYNDTVAKMFKTKGVEFPPKDIYLRAFKAQNEMELWAKGAKNSEYKLIKTYHICALSGILGPKRTEGDRQVPEGCYFIEEFNPKSDFYLSLLLNYPNYSDLILGDKDKPGGDIYIHGGCVTVGCVPMTDDIIQELYVVCLNAKMNGDTYIPVHIYPTRFTKAGLNFLGKEYGKDTKKQEFWVNMKNDYDYFEKHHKLLPVMYSPDGRYVFSSM